MGSENLDELLTKLNTVAHDGSTPEWASLLIDCFKGLIGALKENAQQSSLVAELKSEVTHLRDEIKVIKTSMDDFEQRSRNDCLVLHGIPEANTNVRENTEKIVQENIEQHLGIKLDDRAIKRCHRLGQYKNQRSTRTNRAIPRPIIFRLAYFPLRQEIFGTKKKLKNTGITITENLTRLRYDLYKKALLKFGKGNVWTTEGRIMVKIDGEKKSFTTLEELEEL